MEEEVGWLVYGGCSFLLWMFLEDRGVGVFGDMDMDYLFGCSFWGFDLVLPTLGDLGCGDR